MTTRAEAPPEVEQLLDVFKALANPVRLRILGWLRDPEKNFLEQRGAMVVDEGVCVTHIQEKAGLAQSTVSAYMASLQRAGLVRATRLGKWTHYRRDEERIARIVEVLGHSL
ncbi:helix-turn-helix domain-containing protein [Amycolatopsis sp. NBC_00348]|uniref:ArsR/SmtB family transcription factor n=1 Tax=unclassified Amycolatopsis TaxID=2618356 RepID=UPI002E0D1E4E|nr:MULTISPECIES: metalloregulator ArsR/SmtB family transcription factor [unclassified Amycolatopsis]WSJ79959.1 helix-turn-helix domain-containing protein [Amycolatopsis sp. NBC_01307]